MDTALGIFCGIIGVIAALATVFNMDEGNRLKERIWFWTMITCTAVVSLVVGGVI